MSRSKVEGTKIAQAAKDLNVTSVTIRRYIQEFNIETATDENGIKVLPAQALEELQEIRRLKEDGLTNPKVLEHLEEMRAGAGKAEAKGKGKTKAKAEAKGKSKAKAKVVEEEEEQEEEEEVEEPVRKPKVKATRITSKSKVQEAPAAAVEKEEEEEEKEESSEGEGEEPQAANGEERFMHNLTCQTCSKTFEHANPRLRDCLECYRAKRKERRRGGADKHKKVIENPLAQQVLSKAQSAQAAPSEGGLRDRGDRLERADRSERPERAERGDRLERQSADRPERGDRPERSDRGDRGERPERTDRSERVAVAARSTEPSSWAQMQKPVRSYRKAIEETRLITGSLKRRLERPDLPEGERRWLEQIYAYQLILHQGWRHLAEYKSGSPTPKPQED